MLDVEKQLSKQLLQAFEQERVKVLEHLRQVWDSRGTEYDTRQAVWHRMPYDVKSFVHEIHKTVDRAVSISTTEEGLTYEQAQEKLGDAANYIIALLAYMRLQERLKGVSVELEKTSSV